MVKVGYFCLKQRMMWNNVVLFPCHNLSHILCQQIQLCKLYKQMKEYQSTHNTRINIYIQSENFTCDDLIKKAYDQKMIYLCKYPTYLPT